MVEDPVYVLEQSTSHIRGEKVDAELLPFPGWENTAGLISKRQLELPERIYFEADFDVLAWNEYPVADPAWPIMTQRMLDVLRGVGAFELRAIPIIMINRKLKRAQRMQSDGQYREEALDHRYRAIQLTTHLDAFDWENSLYERHPDLPRAKRIRRLVLKTPPDGFPPIFRLAASPASLLVSAATRAALDAAGVRGPRFDSLRTLEH